MIDTKRSKHVTFQHAAQEGDQRCVQQSERSRSYSHASMNGTRWRQVRVRSRALMRSLPFRNALASARSTERISEQTALDLLALSIQEKTQLDKHFLFMPLLMCCSLPRFFILLMIFFCILTRNDRLIRRRLLIILLSRAQIMGFKSFPVTDI